MDNLDERDKKLIEEREKYEEAYFEHVIDEMMKEDALNKLIAERLENIEESFDFEPSPAFEHLEELYYAEFDRQIQNQIGDVDDYIDYPDGPDENLNGIIIHEPEYEEWNPEPDYLDAKIEEQMKEDARREFIEENPEDLYNVIIDEAFLEYQDEQEKQLQELIKEHYKEEYLDSILIDVLVEESYFEKAIDEIIFDEIGLDYDEDLFDYENDEISWYDSDTYPEDESVIDPFDSLGDIDYPDEEKYMQKADSLFKEYFTENDHLDKIVKRKLREKKFK